MKQTLIAHIIPTISIYADEYQYILTIKANPTQSLANAKHSYHQTLASCFEEILSYMTKLNLADGKDKTMKEIATNIENTVHEIRTLFRPFEDLILSKNTNTAHTALLSEGPIKEKDTLPHISKISKLNNKNYN